MKINIANSATGQTGSFDGRATNERGYLVLQKTASADAQSETLAAMTTAKEYTIDVRGDEVTFYFRESNPHVFSYDYFQPVVGCTRLQDFLEFEENV